MQIAIITDVHGNYPALKAVLEDIERRKSISHIYCLGDMIGIGPYTNEVLETIFSRDDMSVLSGNHEEAVLHILAGKGILSGHEQAAKHHEWIASRLNPEWIPKLQARPVSLEWKAEGHKILMVHYHRTNDKLDAIDNEPSGDKLDTRYLNSGYDLVCFGHHHPVHYFKTDARLYLNPGALGCHHEPIARYGIVDLSVNRLDASLIEVPYDNTDFLQSYERLQVPDRSFILDIFHGNQHLVPKGGGAHEE